MSSKQELDDLEVLVERIQEYFGPYKRDFIRDTVKVYVMSEFDTKRYRELWKAITYYCPSNFGPPGVYEIERASGEYAKNQGSILKKMASSKTPEQREAQEKENWDKVRQEVFESQTWAEFMKRVTRGGENER